MIDQLTQTKHLLPYVKIAEDTAKQSPCVRRKYGAVIAPVIQDTPYYIARNNSRVSNCCNNICERTLRDFPTDGRHISVEVGAEVHAETAALIDYTPPGPSYSVLILVGYKGQHELLGPDAYPCRMCALNIKYAKFRYIYVKNRQGIIAPVSIAEVLEYRENEWQNDV